MSYLKYDNQTRYKNFIQSLFIFIFHAKRPSKISRLIVTKVEPLKNMIILLNLEHDHISFFLLKMPLLLKICFKKNINIFNDFKKKKKLTWMITIEFYGANID